MEEEEDFVDIAIPTLTTVIQLKTKTISDLLENGVLIYSAETLQACEESVEFAKQIIEYNKELYAALAEYQNLITETRNLLTKKIKQYKQTQFH